MSSSRLWVRISNCSRDVLSTCGERSTVQRLTTVGSRTGPVTRAPVRRTVSTISFIERSRRLWSYAFRRMRIFWSADRVTRARARYPELSDTTPAPPAPPPPSRTPPPDAHPPPLPPPRARHHPAPPRPLTPRIHPPPPRRQRAHPRHVRRPKIKPRPIPVEKRRVPPPLLLRQHVHL